MRNSPIYVDPHMEIAKLKNANKFWKAVAVSLFLLLAVALAVIGTIMES
jgi:hypothetical protein